MLRYLTQVAAAVAVLALIAGPAYAMLIRSADGAGNNLRDSDLGKAGTALTRLSPNAYLDGQSEPRGGDPSILPSPRVISNALAAQSRPVYNARRASDWLWQWGQFLDHDLDLTDPAPSVDPFNIAVPLGDPDFDPRRLGGAEIGLQRSVYETDAGGARQQTNAITSFIDASNVYGSDAARAAILRNDLGYLRMSDGQNGEVLMGYNDFDYANAMPAGPGIDPADFFLAGDVRANEQIGLTAVHTLFAREHNRLADELKARLGAGDAALAAERDATIAAIGNGVASEGDFIYEAARKVVGATMQKITYGEFLPVLLGVDLTATYAGYDDGIDPGVSNEFSAAAYRLGHTMLPPSLLRIDGSASVASVVALRDAFFNPAEIFENGVDSLLLGLARQKAQAVDTLLIDDVRNFLFGPPGAGGFDLAALNLQRGRDHGIGALNAVRAALDLDAYGSFLEMTGGDAALAAAFAGVYADVDDVDLWIGGLAESEYGMGMLGETFTRILLDQFLRSMHGDRFFYLREIDTLGILDPDFMTSSTLADVIRRNSSIGKLQANVFFAVPEPSSLVLLTAALVIGGLRLRRSRPGGAVVTRGHHHRAPGHC